MRVLKINGTPVAMQLGTVELSLAANSVTTFRADVYSDGSLVVECDDEVEWVDAETDDVLFAGIVNSYDELAFTDRPMDDLRRIRIVAAGYEVLLSRRVVTDTFPAGDLKQFLTRLTSDWLDSFPVTLDPAQPDGATMPELTYTRMKASDVLADVAIRQEGAIWSVNHDRELLMRLPEDAAAPFDIADDDDPHPVIGDIMLSERREDWFSNRVTVVVTGAGPSTHTQAFVSDGTQTEYVSDFSASADITQPWPQAILTNVDWTWVMWGQTADPVWYWDYVNHKLVNNTGTPMPMGHPITITHAIGYPFAAIYQDDASVIAIGPWEIVITIAERMSVESALYLAELEVQRRLARARIVKYLTDEPGLAPGQSQHIQSSVRDIDGNFFINEVRVKEISKQVLRYAVTAREGGDRETFRDTYRRWFGSDRNVGGVVGTVSVGPSSGFVSMPVPLGGSRNTSVLPSASTWVEVVNYTPLEMPIPVVVIVAVEMWSPDGATLKARLWNMTTSSAAGESGEVTSPTPQRVSFSLVLTPNQRYRLEVQSSMSGVRNYAIGTAQTI